MTHASLFSGIGGFDYAAEQIGWNNLFHCEWNSFCQKILAYHFPNSIAHHDITKTDFTIYRGRVNVLSGGFPCQPYSVAGQQKGTEDPRHLWPQMLRAIREIQPDFVVGENVFGLIGWNGGMVFDQIQTDLEAEGYEVFPYVLPACGVNAPHRRDRVWFIAYSGSNGYKSRGLGQDRPAQSESDSERLQRQWIRPDVRRNGEQEFTSNSYCEKYIWRSGSTGREWQTESENWPRLERPAARNGEEQSTPNSEWREYSYLFDSPGYYRCGNSVFEITSYSNNINGDLPRFRASKVSQQQTSNIQINLDANSRSAGRKEQHVPGFAAKPGFSSRNGDDRERINGFDRFPTQSPICNGNDGLSARLDSITFSSWRNESIKGGGNAIVPAVALQVFKTIEAYLKLT